MALTLQILFLLCNVLLGKSLYVTFNLCHPLGHREQLNQLTAYIDGSFMYGSDPCTARSLRALQGGRLNVTLHPSGRGKPLLPQIDDHPECKAPSGFCFNAGTAWLAWRYPGLA